MPRTAAIPVLRCALSVFALTALSPPLTARAAVDQSAELELLQAQASLSFHSGKNEECLRIIEAILKQEPWRPSALELKALVLKSQNRDDEAERIYRQLIERAAKEKRPAYHFELATLLFKRKDFRGAKRHFTPAARGAFNKGTSHFFLGMIDTSGKNWRGARKNFAASLLYADAAQMKPISRYYLAAADTQSGKSGSAIRNYVQTAMDAAEARPGSPLAAQHGDLKKNAVDALKAYNQRQAFATVTLMQQWDSDATVLPDTVTTGQQASGKKTAKAILSAVAGYSTAPTGKYQWVPSNAIYTNYNYNGQSRDMNFFSDTPTLYLFYKPYARLTPGLKAAGTFNMKRQHSPSDGSDKYRSYSLTGDFGPQFRFSALPTVDLGLETSYKPKKYYGEAEGSDDRRTGSGFYARFSTEWNSELEWLTPAIALSYEWDDTLGTAYRSQSYGLNIQNPLSFAEKWDLTPSVDVLSTDYYKLRPQRTDVTLTAKIAAAYKLAARWVLLGDASYIKNNSSNSASFTYTRIVASAGATYSF